MKNVWFFLFLLTIIPHSWAQESQIKPTIFDKSDGFELSNTSSIEADNDGFLWFAGQNLYIRDIFGTDKKLALQRFNGSSFDNIVIPENKGKVLLSNQVFKRADGQFYVHISTAGKNVIILFDPITTQFKFFKNPQQKNPRQSLSRVHQYEGKNYVLGQDGKKITLYQLKNDLKFHRIFSFNSGKHKVGVSDAKINFSKNHVVISDNNMPIHAFDWQGKLKRKYNSEDFGIKNLSSMSQMAIDDYFHHKGKFYFFLLQNPQLYELNLNTLETKKTEGLQLKRDNLHVLQKGNKKLITCHNEKHLTVLELDEKNISQIVTDTILFNPDVGGASVQKVFSRDLNKEVWIVTNNQQLLHYSIEKKSIQNALKNQSIRALHPFDKDNILVATDAHGWFKLNYRTNRSEPFVMTEKGKSFLPVSSRAFIQNGRVLWNSDFASIMKVNLDTRKVFLSKNYPISCIAKKSNSQLIYGSNRFQLVQYNIKTDEHVTLLKTDSLNIIDLKIYKDWVISGTSKGLLLYQFSTKTHRFIQKTKSLTDPYILSVSKISEGVFALGTKFGKVFSFDIRTMEIKLVYEDELNAGIANMLIDDNSKWWLSTFDGLVCFDPKTKVKLRYSTSNGLTNNEANRYSSLKIGNMLFFGSYKGLNYFSTDRLKPASEGAKLALMMSEVFDDEKNEFQSNLNRKFLNAQSHFYLPAVQRSLKMRFAVQAGKVGGKYTINYRLNNDRWSTVNQKNELSYSNLASGNYNLEVKLVDFSGKQVGKTLKYSLEIKQFFYNTVWFYLLIVFIGLTILTWYLFQMRKQAKMRENFSEDLIHSQENERARISKELHDSVGQQLTLLKKTAQNRDQIEISDLANNTLEEVRAISKNLHPPLLTELGLTESIRALIHAFDEETDLFFTVDLVNIDSFYDQKGALQIYRFVQEGLSNLMKHAKAKTAYIEITVVDDKQVKIVIKDDGIGIKTGAKNFSLGLTTMQERIRILNGNFIIEKPKKGTKLVAKIPVE